MNKKNIPLAILEVVIVFVVTLMGCGLVSASPIGDWERTVLGRFFVIYALMIAIPIIILLTTRRKLADFGISLSNFKYHLDIALACFLPYAVAITLEYFIKFKNPAVNFLLSMSLTTALLFTLGWLLKKKPSLGGVAAMGIILAFSPFLGAPGLGAPTQGTPTLGVLGAFSPGKALSALLYYTLFLGPGEEILFRGYIQSRLNQAFGRPFQFMGIPWGWGLVITSLLFGFFHVLNLVHLFQGVLDLQWWAMSTFFWGLVFGLVREKTGSVVAPALLHGVPQGIAWAYFGL